MSLWLTVVVVSLTAIGLTPAPEARAESPLTDSTSLKFIPADASFYTSGMRNREVFDAVVKSKAFAKVMEMPSVKMGVAMLQQQMKDPDSPVAMPLAMLKMPENKQALAVLGDMVSNEIFIYGDKGFAEMLVLMMQANQEFRGVMMDVIEAEGVDGGEDMDEKSKKAMIDLAMKYLDKVKTPDLFIGFKLKDTKAAQTQLERIAALLPPLLAQVPQLKGKLKKEKIENLLGHDGDAYGAEIVDYH